MLLLKAPNPENVLRRNDITKAISKSIGEVLKASANGILLYPEEIDELRRVTERQISKLNLNG